MTIHAFGDDHARQIFELCTNVRLHWLGPYTMHRVGHGGAFRTLEIGMPTSGDTIIYMVGAEDVRNHLFRHGWAKGADITAASTSLTEQYVTAVRWLKTLLDFPITVCVVGIVAPAAPKWDDPIRPANGSFEQRRRAREALNIALRRQCEAMGVAFVQIPKVYETRSGALRPSLSDGWGHIAPHHAHHLCSAIERIVGLDIGYPRPDFFSGLLREYARVRAACTGDIASLQGLGSRFSKRRHA